MIALLFLLFFLFVVKISHEILQSNRSTPSVIGWVTHKPWSDDHPALKAQIRCPCFALKRETEHHPPFTSKLAIFTTQPNKEGPLFFLSLPTPNEQSVEASLTEQQNVAVAVCDDMVSTAVVDEVVEEEIVEEEIVMEQEEVEEELVEEEIVDDFRPFSGSVAIVDTSAKILITGLLRNA